MRLCCGVLAKLYAKGRLRFTPAVAGNFSFPRRGVIILVIALLLVAGALFYKAPDSHKEISVDAFKQLLQDHQVFVDSGHFLQVYAQQNNRIARVTGFYRNPPSEIPPHIETLTHFETEVPPEQDSQILTALLNSGVKFDLKTEYFSLPAWSVGLLPYLIFGIVIVRLVFRLRRASRARP
jgi:hypothetical protein